MNFRNSIPEGTERVGHARPNNIPIRTIVYIRFREIPQITLLIHMINKNCTGIKIEVGFINVYGTWIDGVNLCGKHQSVNFSHHGIFIFGVGHVGGVIESIMAKVDMNGHENRSSEDDGDPKMHFFILIKSHLWFSTRYLNANVGLRVRPIFNALVVDLLKVNERFGGFPFQPQGQPIQNVKDAGTIGF